MSPFAVHHVRPVPGAPPVVLLHGVYADHHLWDPVLPLLDGLDVTALDSPGHGTAGRRGPLAPLDEQVAQLAALLRDRLRTPATLAGHSWGGMLGLRLAVAHPELVDGLLLTDTPLRRARGASRLGFLLQRELLRAGLPAGTYGRVAARALHGRDHRRDHPEVVEDTARTTAALGRRGITEVITRILLEPGDALDLLPRLGVPVALVAGVDDYVGSPKEQAHVRAAGFTLDLHPGGHAGPREAPAHLARRLRALVPAHRPLTAGDR